jgi:hypothetical protein
MLLEEKAEFGLITGFSGLYGSGGGTRTPDTRIMIPLL